MRAFACMGISILVTTQEPGLRGVRIHGKTCPSAWSASFHPIIKQSVGGTIDITSPLNTLQKHVIVDHSLKIHIVCSGQRVFAYNIANLICVYPECEQPTTRKESVQACSFDIPHTCGHRAHNCGTESAPRRCCCRGIANPETRSQYPWSQKNQSLRSGCEVNHREECPDNQKNNADAEHGHERYGESYKHSHNDGTKVPKFHCARTSKRPKKAACECKQAAKTPDANFRQLWFLNSACHACILYYSRALSHFHAPGSVRLSLYEKAHDCPIIVRWGDN